MNILAGLRSISETSTWKVSISYPNLLFANTNRSSGVEGKVEIDGVERNLKHFRKQSAYITQQDHLLKHLTVYEYLEGAAHLKIGNRVPNKEKKLTVCIV